MEAGRGGGGGGSDCERLASIGSRSSIAVRGSSSIEEVKESLSDDQRTGDRGLIVIWLPILSCWVARSACCVASILLSLATRAAALSALRASFFRRSALVASLRRDTRG